MIITWDCFWHMQVNPSSIFVSSSPTKGPIIDTEDEFVPRWGWIGDTRYGSVHHYDYMSDCENFRSYPTAKFVTEFGESPAPASDCESNHTDAHVCAAGTSTVQVVGARTHPVCG